MKKTLLSALALCLCACLLLGSLSACGSVPNADGGKLQIVATIFPIYDWVREILGDRLADTDLTLLLDNGVDLHSYQPGAQDLMRVSQCDLFVYVGGNSDAWVTDALGSVQNPDRVAVSLLETLGEAVKVEEIVEGMEAEEEDEEEGVEYDEHVWLSLRNASVLVNALADSLGKVDPDHASVYVRNAQAYTSKLDALEAQYADAAAAASVKTLLFADRFPFRYLADDYGLSYYAAFSGCSAETEASFRTITFLAEKTDELGLRNILQVESADGSIARTVRENTRTKDQQILTLNSLQSAASQDVEQGLTYLSAMTENLEVLKTALQ
ncbi:MAG: zinc ABC transporter substrate-binding protein [Clostridia bacterium]|nr:zinc ABC transporter substrate-binding protein [Clostridia bacterium]